jgi:Ca2+/H+ antiporter
MGLGATVLFFEWLLGLAVFTGGLGEEQLTRNNNNAGKILLIILIIYCC